MPTCLFQTMPQKAGRKSLSSPSCFWGKFGCKAPSRHGPIANMINSRRCASPRCYHHKQHRHGVDRSFGTGNRVSLFDCKFLTSSRRAALSSLSSTSPIFTTKTPSVTEDGKKKKKKKTTDRDGAYSLTKASCNNYSSIQQQLGVPNQSRRTFHLFNRTRNPLLITRTTHYPLRPSSSSSGSADDDSVVSLRTRHWFSSSSSSGGDASRSNDDNNVSSKKKPGKNAKQKKQDHAHCVDLVRSRDMEGYLCGLLMPSSARNAYFAVRAFNVEIASIKDGGAVRMQRSRRDNRRPVGMDNIIMSGGNTHDDSPSSLASRLRMQWWRDAVDEIYDNDDADDHVKDNRSNADHEEGAAYEPSTAGFLSSAFTSTSTRQQNPVVRELQRATAENKLTRRFLDRMINAREYDLDIDQFSSLDELMRYSEETISSFLYLSLECAGIRDEHADEVASHIGIGLGLVTALRSTAYRAARGEISIPVDVMKKHSVPSEYLLIRSQQSEEEGEEGEDLSNNSETDRAMDIALREAVREMASVASAHLSRARQLQGSVPKMGRPSLLPAVGALHYLERLEKADFDVFDTELNNAQKGRFALTFLLGRAWLTGVF